MRTPLFLILLLFINVKVNSQSIFQTVGSENIGIANCTTNSINLWSGFENSAGLASINQLIVGSTFLIKYNKIGALSSAIGLAKPVKKGTAFLGVFRFGDNIYNEHRVSLAYGSKIGIVQIGGRVNYLQYQIQDFGALKSYSLDLGVQAQLAPFLKIGAFANNISRSMIQKEYKLYAPSIISIGIQYLPLDYFHFFLEIEKNLSMDALLKSAVKYQLNNNWNVSTGIQAGSWETYYGTGFQFIHLLLNYAYSLHPILGSSHAIDLGFKF